MKFREIYPMLRACQMSKSSVLVEAKHGIGKSRLFKDFAKENNCHFEHIFAPQFESAGDVIGIPRTKTADDGVEIMEFTRPSWLHRMWQAHSRGQKSVLLVDEFNRANEDIRQMGLAWFLDHTINSHEFPPNTLVATAINPEDKGDYAVNSLDPAQMSRFVRLELDVDAEGWIMWAKENDIHPLVTSFIISNQTYLHNEVPGQPMNSDPRAWELLSNALKKLEEEKDSIKKDIFQLNVLKLSIGKVGTNAGMRFYDHYKNNNTLELADVLKFIEKKGLKKLFSEEEFLTVEKKALTTHDKKDLDTLKKEYFPKVQEVGKELAKQYEERGVQTIKLNTFAKDILDSLTVKKDDGKEGLKSLHVKDNVDLLAFLYSLPPELLASTLKDIRDRNTYLAVDIGGLDSGRHLTNSVVKRLEKK